MRFFNELNWVDVFVVILFFRIVYISAASGLFPELLRFLGILCATYLSLHYFTGLTDFISNYLPEKNLRLEAVDFVTVIVLAVIGVIIFVLLRSIINRFIKMEAASGLNKWGGIVFGVGRAYLTCSLVLFILVMSTFPYLQNSIAHSYLGKRLFKAAPDTYSWIWNNISSKFIPNEKYNAAVSRVEEGFAKLK